MKVVMISKALVVGAYQRKCEELAALRGMELHAVVPEFWQEPGGRRIALERAHLSGYRLHVAPLALNGHFHLHYYPGLAGVLRAVRPDIVHIDEEPYNLATLQALVRGRQVGASCLFFTWQNLYRRLPPPWSWIEWYVLGRADHALAGNAEAVDVLRRKGYRGACTVIPQFGVDPDAYSPGPPAERSPVFTVGYIGRLVEEKGLLILLDALSKLQGDWRLEITGQGPLQPRLEVMAAELGIAGRVAFRPGVPSSDVPGLLRRLDCLVLPSLTRPNWKEQFGRVLVEAMACQVPVVGSDSGEIPHLIGEAGLVVPEGDAAALAAAIGRLRDDAALRARLGFLGRERVLANFTQHRIAQETYAVYRAMAGGAATGV